MELPQLGTIEGYFRQGLDWNRDFPIYSILESRGIVPGAFYTHFEVYSVIKDALEGRNPGVQCYHDAEARTFNLGQIHICFDKELRLADCDGIHGGLNNGCPGEDGMLYYPMDKDIIKTNSAAQWHYSSVNGVTIITVMVIATIIVASKLRA